MICQNIKHTPQRLTSIEFGMKASVRILVCLDLNVPYSGPDTSPGSICSIRMTYPFDDHHIFGLSHRGSHGLLSDS